MLCLNTELAQNLRHVNILLMLWAQLFEENLGIGQLAEKLEGILNLSIPGSVPYKRKKVRKVRIFFRHFRTEILQIPAFFLFSNFAKTGVFFFGDHI